jgi:C1A family cysteine protease
VGSKRKLTSAITDEDTPSTDEDSAMEGHVREPKHKRSARKTAARQAAALASSGASAATASLEQATPMDVEVSNTNASAVVHTDTLVTNSSDVHNSNRAPAEYHSSEMSTSVRDVTRTSSLSATSYPSIVSGRANGGVGSISNSISAGSIIAFAPSSSVPT